MSIELIIGPMFCGKTTELKAKIERYALAMKNCLVIKYNDGRYSYDVLCTHNKEKLETTAEYGGLINVICTNVLDGIIIDDVDIIAIDEGQFYNNLIENVIKWATLGKVVIISALNGDSNQETFGEICKLIPKCESVISLRGICMKCRSRESSFSIKLVKNDKQMEIGGKDKYISVCRKCL